MTVGPDFLSNLKGIPAPVTKSGGAPKAVRGKAPSTASGKPKVATTKGGAPTAVKGAPKTTTTSGGGGGTKPKKPKPVVDTILPDQEQEEAPTRDWEKEYYDRLRQEQRVSAFAIIKDAFDSYGLSELAPVVEGYLREGISTEEATIRLRQTDVYKKRFAGNEGRRALGLPAYTEDEYLTAEATYRELLSTNRLDTLANRDTYAKLIGGGVSVSEAQDRISTVFKRIDNADENLKQQFGRYFSQYGVTDPTLQRADVASAILGGPETAQTLQRTLQKAELRAGAAGAKVDIGEQRIEELQKQLESAGVSDVYSTAKAGFSTLAQTQPVTEVLAERYKVGTEGLAQELEQEAFFGLQSQRRKKLQEQEKATFAGQAGTTQVSLAQKTAGQF